MKWNRVRSILVQSNVATWITIIATTLLGFEMWLIVSAAWDQIGTIGQAVLVITTATLVLMFGYGKKLSAEGFIGTTKRKRKTRK